jgi:GntR family transcriptional regulator, transcriptional repressor for pyruvate dehydrogenase complex
MEFTPILNRRAYRGIVDQVCDSILRGDLKKGDRLPSERDIALQSGASRTIVREALKVLLDADMVQMKTGGGGGTQIVSDSIPTQLLGLAMETRHQRLIEFYETRNIIETAAAELTAARSTPEQIEELDQVVQAMEKLVKEQPNDRQNFSNIDARFHRLVVKSAGNHVLFNTYVPILRQIFLVNDLTDVKEMCAYGLPTMKDFVQAVKERNPQEARLAIHAHIRPLVNFIDRYFTN